MINISEQDVLKIKRHGLSIEDFIQQIKNFENGFEPIKLHRAASLGDGIVSFNQQEIEDFISLYNQEKNNYSICKFVPASGAATRMMKDLYTFLDEYVDEQTTPLSNFAKAQQLLENIEKFAFYSILKNAMAEDGLDINECLNNQDYKTVIEYILTEKGLNYGHSPKAWILFHQYNGRNITPFEEHLIEAAEYCQQGGQADIEFSILKQHKAGFDILKQNIVPYYERLFGIKYNISFSYQKHSTDTIAVDMNNQPVLDENGDFVFRPAGHGALLENLNSLPYDIIFIKNIDNVSSQYRHLSARYKQFLAGVLIYIKTKAAKLQGKFKGRPSKQELVSICRMMKNQLFISELKNFSEFDTMAQYKHYLLGILNRPIRICGMVKNEGEPGGGPFFVLDENGVSLQIVEKAQVDQNDPLQNHIFLNSTHFNPVDLVISPISANGRKFNLKKHIDPNTGFISEKSFEGQVIKAQERPGLWNGSMSDWLTIFVEVPVETFSPVKTINDLLKPQHLISDDKE